MKAAEIRARIVGKTLLEYVNSSGYDIVYQFLLYAFDDPRKIYGTVSDFVCGLPDEEVEQMFEESKLKYAQQQIEQDL